MCYSFVTPINVCCTSYLWTIRYTNSPSEQARLAPISVRALKITKPWHEGKSWNICIISYHSHIISHWATRNSRELARVLVTRMSGALSVSQDRSGLSWIIKNNLHYTVLGIFRTFSKFFYYLLNPTDRSYRTWRINHPILRVFCVELANIKRIV